MHDRTSVLVARAARSVCVGLPRRAGQHPEPSCCVQLQESWVWRPRTAQSPSGCRHPRSRKCPRGRSCEPVTQLSGSSRASHLTSCLESLRMAPDTLSLSRWVRFTSLQVHCSRFQPSFATGGEKPPAAMVPVWFRRAQGGVVAGRSPHICCFQILLAAGL